MYCSYDIVIYQCQCEDFISGNERVARQVNHPPHILTEASQSTLSSSSFIPFCQFGDSLSVLGQAAPQFRHPVCSAFSEGVLEGQVCYSLDLNTLRPELEWRDSMQFGLGLLLDTNTELDRRQMYFRNSNTDTEREASLSNLVRFELGTRRTHG